MAGTDVQVTSVATKGMDIEGDPGRANNYAHLRVAGADVSGSNKVPVLAATTDTLLGTSNTNTAATATALGTTNTSLGATNETSAAADNSTSGLNGLLKRLLARITTLLVLPASLGQKAKTASLPVTLATDEDLLPMLGATNETSAAADNSTSGLNGLVKRLLARLTTLLILPASLGTKTAAASLAVTLASDEAMMAILNNGITTITVTIQRPANATPYDPHDLWTLTTPTPGGTTFANAARASGKSGYIVGMEVFAQSAPTATPALTGVLHLFDTAITASADNAIIAISDTEILTQVAAVPFSMATIGLNQQCSLEGLAYPFTTVGSADLRGIVRVTNTYTPVTSEQLTIRLKVVWVN